MSVAADLGPLIAATPSARPRAERPPRAERRCGELEEGERVRSREGHLGQEREPDADKTSACPRADEDVGCEQARTPRDERSVRATASYV
mmetsp:Transcript_46391/g.107876  ORF Transcript_46391/g.107876 Transcript_46391/m.107876 type:complete len:90 (-) Transcript_46391:387-656(-)